MINEPLVYFEHEDAFNAQVSAGNITNGAQNEQVIFLGDSKKILTHGKEFGSGKIYTEGDGIQIDASNVISQRVATSNKLGGIKTGYAASGRNFAVSVDNNGNAYVNVPAQQIDIPEYTPYDDQWIHDALDAVDGQIDGLEEDLDGINNWSEEQISDIVTNRLDTWEWLTRGVIFEQDFTEDSDGENSEDPTKYGFLLSYGTAGGPSKTNYQVVNGVLQCQAQINAGEGGRSGAATAVFNEIGLGNYLYLSYKWSLGGATGDNNYAYTKTSIGNAAGKALELAFYGQEGRLLVNGQEVLKNTNIRNAVYNVTATINLNRQKITSLQMTCSNTNYNYGTTEEFSFKDAITTIDRFTFENSSRATWTNTSSIDDVLITFEGEFGQSGWNSALATWMSLNGYVTKDSAEWTEIVQRMDGIEATANYVYKVVDSDGNVKWETLSSGLGLSVLPDLQQSVATLTAMWADGTENDQALDWLLAGFRASANGNDHTAMTSMFATTSYADSAASAAVNAIANNYYTKAEIGTLFEDNLAGVVTTSDLDGSVASLFAANTESDTKAAVSAMVEGGVSSVTISADQITLDGTTWANTIWSDFSGVHGTGWYWDDDEELMIFGSQDDIEQSRSGEYIMCRNNPTPLFFSESRVSSGIGMENFTLDYYGWLGVKGVAFASYLDSSIDDEPTVYSILTRDGLVMRDDRSSADTNGALTVSSQEIEMTTVTGNGEVPVITINGDGLKIKYTDENGYENSSYDIVLDGRTSMDPGMIECYHLLAQNTVYCLSLEQTSDRNKKDIIDDVELTVDQIANAPAVRFTWKGDNSGAVNAGTIAQYWYGVLPEVVSETKRGDLAMQYGNAAMISVISTAKEVVALKEEVAELKRQIAELMSK